MLKYTNTQFVFIATPFFEPWLQEITVKCMPFNCKAIGVLYQLNRDYLTAVSCDYD